MKDEQLFRYEYGRFVAVELPEKDEISTRDKLYESLQDDEAVMRGYRAVRKMLQFRDGTLHDHAEAFRNALKGEDDETS